MHLQLTIANDAIHDSSSLLNSPRSPEELKSGNAGEVHPSTVPTENDPSVATKPKPNQYKSIT